MKKILYILLIVSAYANGQIVNIPDPVFKAKLLSANATNQIAYINGAYGIVDTNSDGEIQLSEAANVQRLNFQNYNQSQITDFTGINSFVNLLNFASSFNNAEIHIQGLLYLQSINVTQNHGLPGSTFSNLPSLTNFYFRYTNAASLSVTNCPAIVNFYAHENLNMTSLTTTAMPALKIFEIWYCKIAGSISIPNSPLLEKVKAYSNQFITNFSIGNSPLLQELDISGNNITSVSGFVNNLSNIRTLRISGNHIQNLILPVSMPLLETISFDGTSTNNLNFGSYPNLSTIVILDGNMVNLDVSNVVNLSQFHVFGNLFTSIDISHNLLMNSFYVQANPYLNEINMKNGVNELNIGFNGIPNVSYICCDAGQTTQVQSIVTSNNMVNTVVNSYCSFTPQGNYNVISGTMKLDANDNGCDANDAFSPNIKLLGSNATTQVSTYTYTDYAGNYNFFTGSGNLTLTPNVENTSFFTFSPPTVTIPFANSNNNTVQQNFCVTPNGIHNDVEIVIVPITTVRPGFNAIYNIIYRNKGNQTVSGSMTFEYEEPVLDFFSSSVVPNIVSPGSLGWNYANLMPFESRSITVTLNANSPIETPPLNIGDQLDYAATINPISADAFPADNSFDYKQIVVGSFDPNDKTCLEGSVVSSSKIGDYLHYNINFENTGTYPATFIVVKDIIDSSKFDVNSLQLLYASHPMDTRILGNTVEFIFDNINLPQNGHGNVTFKIKTKSTLTVGTTVANKADIYFDYNFPVITNLASTVFQTLGEADFESDDVLMVYPNPTDSILHVKSDSDIKSLQLYDVQGRLLQTSTANGLEVLFDISQKSNGIYFLKVTSDKGVKTTKIIKE